MSLENRSNSALFKRAEQLKRWEQSETNREPPDPKQISKKIKFSADCVFLAACAAGDKDEVIRLLQKGADINTGNVDGLTALHQACIDDDLDMVEFLVEQGADINRGDNEGWTPLHATASCGFISIAKYLIEKGCNLAAVNNDGELALDITESDEMEEMLQKHITKAGIDCDKARSEEERLMLADARAWRSGAPGKDSVHPRSGATALHVAAAKGYSTVMSILLQARCDVNARDNDGWTPLHAAAHWGQIDACKLLVENFCDMDIKNYAGQTAFDIADPDIGKALEELKEKQEVLLKDHPQIINKQPVIPKKRVSTTKENIGIDQEGTETYEEETPNKVKKVELEIQSDKEESSVGTNSDVEKKNRVNREETAVHSPQPSPDKVPNQAPIIPPKQQIENNDEGNVPSWRRSGSFRTRGVDNEAANSVPAKIEREKPVVKSPTSPTKVPEEQEVVLRRTHSFETDEKKKDIKLNLELSRVPQSNSTQSVSTLNDRKSLPATPVSANLNAVTSPVPVNQIRRSFVPPVRDEESETQRKAHAKRVRETRRSTQGVTLDEIKSAEQLVKKKQQQSNDVLGSTATTTTSGTTTTSSSVQPLSSSISSNNNNSANSNSTSNNNNGSSISNLNSNNSSNSNNNNNGQTTTASITATITTASPTTTVLSKSASSASATADQESNQPERRPSWRLKVDAGSKFQLEDANNRSSATGTTDTATAYIRRPGTGSSTTTGTTTLRPNSAPADSSAVVASAEATVTLPLRRPVKPPEDKEQDKENDSRNAQATQAVIQRRRRPKRRSTGVVHVDMDEIDPEKQDGTGECDDSKVNHNESGHERSGRSSRLGSVSSLSSESGTNSTRASKSLSNASENGELDYKKLYEESQAENERLRDKLRKSDEQLKEAQGQVERAQNAQGKLALSETEKRERRAMERKLSEMEEELKMMETLKCENQRLKDENGALIRVISKLSK